MCIVFVLSCYVRQQATYGESLWLLMPAITSDIAGFGELCEFDEFSALQSIRCFGPTEYTGVTDRAEALI